MFKITTKYRYILFLAALTIILCVFCYKTISSNFNADIAQVLNRDTAIHPKYCQENLNIKTDRRHFMGEDNDPEKKHIGIPKYSFINPDPVILDMEQQLRQANLIWRKDIQKLLKTLYCSKSKNIREVANHRIQVALDAYDINKMRKPNTFIPYGPKDLLSQGDLCLLIQKDGVKWLIYVDNLLTGLTLLGPQQGGKSREIMNICLGIRRIDPDIVITIIDPKDGFSDYASLLGAKRTDLGKTSLNLKTPMGVLERDFVLEFIPMLSDSAGLIYGTEILNEAALIALAQKQNYIEATGKETDLCLKDIYVAISLVKNTSSGRRQGYREAAQTALRRIMGEKELFACRKGLSLDNIFTHNSIINARSLTDDMQCRAVILNLLYHKFQQCRYKPETNKLEHLIIVDDASRFIGTAGDQFGASSKTSPIGHILALLRATGTGVVFATQLPAFMDPSVTALSRSMIVVGGMAGSQHLKVISDFMSLNKEQAKAITQLSTREAVGFAPGTAYKECVYGWVPFVDDPLPSNVGGYNNDSDDFGCEPWHNLADIPAQPAKVVVTHSSSNNQTEPADIKSAANLALAGVSVNTRKLVWDCVCYPYHSISSRIKRLSISGRAFENAKHEGCEKGLLIESSAGQTVYLIPTEKTFQVYGEFSPYKRNVSTEHAFYVGLGVWLLAKDPQNKSVRPEVPIGKSGASSDIVMVAHNGTLNGWEVTLSTTNLLSNATKYANTSFAKIFFLCRNWKLQEAVKAFFRESGLDPELLAKLEFTHFSALLHRQRKLYSF